MSKFQRSWLLFKSSLTIMLQNKKLLLFPVVTTGCLLIITLFFLTPVAFQRTGYSYGSGKHWQSVLNGIFQPEADTNPSVKGVASESNSSTAVSRSHSGDRSLRPAAAVYIAVLYFVSMFVATFFNVAFYSEILKAFNGQPVSIRAGLQFACTKWKPVLLWTIFAGLVGYLIKMLEERFGFVGRLVLRLVGTAWSIACVFVIPVIIREEETINPLVMLKKSALTLKNTWGESLIGYAGVSFGGLIVLLGSLVILGVGVAISIALNNFWILALVGVGWLISLFAIMYLMSVASQIFRCALYLYATEGTIPQPFDDEMIAMAWKVKKS
jgi:hypothetical protein